MNITYAAGAEDPRIDEILKDMAIYNPDAKATVSMPDRLTHDTDTWRQVVFVAPELDLDMAIRAGIIRLSSKRSGANTVVTIKYRFQ